MHNLKASWQVTKHWQLAAIGRNIGNHNARTPSLYSQPQASISNDIPVHNQQWLLELQGQF